MSSERFGNAREVSSPTGTEPVMAIQMPSNGIWTGCGNRVSPLHSLWIGRSTQALFLIWYVPASMPAQAFRKELIDASFSDSSAYCATSSRIPSRQRMRTTL